MREINYNTRKMQLLIDIKRDQITKVNYTMMMLNDANYSNEPEGGNIFQ